MKNYRSLLFLLLLVSFSTASAQYSYLSSLNFYPRYARALRMGDTYTGIARGMESMFYNPAGLAADNQFGIIYSSGHGLLSSIEMSPSDIAIAAPLPDKLGTAGISYENLSDKIPGSRITESIYSLHYARNISNNLAVGASLNYSLMKIENSGNWFTPRSEFSGGAFDLSLSVLMNIPVSTSPDFKDDFRFGVFIKNILNTNLELIAGQADPASQLLRTGFSYSISPRMEKYHELNPLVFTVAADAVFQGTKYEIYDWQPNFALEVALYEILQVSFGRENRLDYKESRNVSNFGYPVNRYGFGLIIPVSRLLEMKNRFNIEFNYCRSDWQKIEDDTRLPYGGEARTDAFSISAGFSL